MKTKLNRVPSDPLAGAATVSRLPFLYKQRARISKTATPAPFNADAQNRISTGSGESAPAFPTQEPDNMSAFTKLDAIRKHLHFPRPIQELPRKAAPAPDTGKRVQKNLTILERDAERLAALAKRDGLSQAGLLSAALDAYEARRDDRTKPGRLGCELKLLHTSDLE